MDALVFTGGIGDNSGAVRALIAGRLATLGIQPIDSAATATVDQRLNPPDALVALLRIDSREDLVIAAQTAQSAGLSSGLAAGGGAVAAGAGGLPAPPSCWPRRSSRRAPETSAPGLTR